MADQNIRLKWLADSRAAQQQMAAMEKKMRKMEAAQKATNRASQKGQGQFSGAIRGQLSGLKSMAAGYFGVAAAISAVIQEHQNLINVQRTRLKLGVSTGVSFEQLRLNFLADKSIKDEAALGKATQGIAQRQSIPIADVNKAAQSALSAKGGQSNAQALKAVETAFRISADAEFAEAFSGGILDIAKFSGVKDSRKIAGFLRQSQVKARTVSPQAFAENVPAVIAAEKTLGGGTSETAAELFAFLTGESADKTGETSRTGSINLIRRLSEFTPQRKFATKRGERFDLTQEKIDNFLKTQSTSERISQLQQDPALSRQFTETQPLGKGKLRGAIIGLLSGEAGSKRRLEDIRKGILSPQDPSQVGRFEEFAAGRERAPFAKQTKFQRQVDAAEERFRLSGSKTQAGFARESFEKVMKNIVFDFMNAPGVDVAGGAAARGEFAGQKLIAGQGNEITAAIATFNQILKGTVAPGVDPEERKFIKEQIAVLKDIRRTLTEGEKRNPNRNAQGEGGK